MKMIEFTPEAIDDLQNIREYVKDNFGENTAESVVRNMMNSIEVLRIFPESGNDILARYGVISDYLCLFINSNYVFYRIENDMIKIIRVLNEKQDFMNILFGIRTTSLETEDYWDE